MSAQLAQTCAVSSQSHRWKHKQSLRDTPVNQPLVTIASVIYPLQHIRPRLELCRNLLQHILQLRVIYMLAIDRSD